MDHKQRFMTKMPPKEVFMVNIWSPYGVYALDASQGSVHAKNLESLCSLRPRLYLGVCSRPSLDILEGLHPNSAQECVYGLTWSNKGVYGLVGSTKGVYAKVRSQKRVYGQGWPKEGVHGFG